jgi:uracil-DNA glycosylase
MPDCLALEGTKQIRPDAVVSLGSVAAHFTLGEKGRRRYRLRRDRNLRKSHPANVRSGSNGRRILMQLCQR